MKNVKKITGMAVLTFLLIFITAFCISGTVHSQDKNDSVTGGPYDRTVRQEYLQTIRTFLEEKGYGNSGVTMNYVINEDGSIEYTVTIHHRKIDKLDDEGKNLLAEECKALAVPSDLSIVFL